jgi:hypothetical protein
MTQKHRPWGATTKQLTEHAKKTAAWYRNRGYDADVRTAETHDRAAQEYREGSR